MKHHKETEDIYMTIEEAKKKLEEMQLAPKKKYMDIIHERCPEEKDERLVRLAAGFMLDADDEGVELSPVNALRLAKAYKPTPIAKLVEDFHKAGIRTAEDLDKVFEKLDKEDPPVYGDLADASAAEKAEKLEMFAAELTKNPDIILLGRPMLWEMDTAWVKLAVLCSELTPKEQDILSAMREISDDGVFQFREGIPIVTFDINNIHAK